MGRLHSDPVLGGVERGKARLGHASLQSELSLPGIARVEVYISRIVIADATVATAHAFLQA
jgi:hypothetical protein